LPHFPKELHIDSIDTPASLASSRRLDPVFGSAFLPSG